MTPRRLTPFRQALLGLALGVVYGLVCRLLFDPQGGFHRADSLRELWAIMSLSFIFLVPFALGFLVIWFGETKKSWAARVFQPWLAGAMFMAAAIVCHL